MGKILGKGGNNDDDVGGNVEGKGGRKGRHQVFAFYRHILNEKLSNS